MSGTRNPLILYVPGLLPKPEPEIHKAALRRCLLEGVRRADPDIAADIAATERAFDLVGWTYDFYREHRDIRLDSAAINDVVIQQDAGDADIREATSWRRRATIWLYRLGNLMPFLIPHLASEKMEVHLHDLNRYERNRNGIGDHIREMLKTPLRAAWEGDRPVLLVAHSMGSVIAYDSLWEMTHSGRDELRVDLLLSMGSPLGQNHLQKRIKGHDKRSLDRYPNNIRRWINLAAVGELTAVDPQLENDFGEMVELGLTEGIDDLPLFNVFRLEGQLNVHAEYGYLANAVSGHVIANWWREQR